VARPRDFLTASETPEKRRLRQSWTGWPIPGIGLRVVHSDGRDVRADGEQIGEIIVRSNTVMSDYYKDPEATAETIRDGWLYTGDMAVIDDQGYVLIKDRSKDIIIRGGENISSVEVENAILAHPAVLECAVVSAPDKALGEAPVAIVVLKPGEAATPKELREHCKGRLARFKVPRDIHFRDSLPKGGTGKVLKAELREPFWKGHDARVQ
jgi:fatty-acyl-CoA synthase